MAQAASLAIIDLMEGAPNLLQGGPNCVEVMELRDVIWRD